MITEYFRPQTLEEALTLLSKPNTVPLGGGTLLAAPRPGSIKVVDLQALGLNVIKKQGNNLEIGAMVTLQQLLESKYCPEALKAAIKLEAPLNIRDSATLAGTLVASNGRSPLTTMLLAMDGKIDLRELAIVKRKSSKASAPESRSIALGEFLPLRPRALITLITVPLNAKFAFEYVSRTPADKPVVCAAMTQWTSGRTRLTLGGCGKNPMLAVDGTEAAGLEAAARSAYQEAADEYASAEYRSDIAATLARRCLEEK